MTRTHSNILGSASIEPDDDLCPAEAYAAMEAQIREDEGTGHVSFLAEHRGEIAISVSHGDNLLFDPVTGRGDNREDLARAHIDFSGEISSG